MDYIHYTLPNINAIFVSDNLEDISHSVRRANDLYDLHMKLPTCDQVEAKPLVIPAYHCKSDPEYCQRAIFNPSAVMYVDYGHWSEIPKQLGMFEQRKVGELYRLITFNFKDEANAWNCSNWFLPKSLIKDMRSYNWEQHKGFFEELLVQQYNRMSRKDWVDVFIGDQTIH